MSEQYKIVMTVYTLVYQNYGPATIYYYDNTLQFSVVTTKNNVIITFSLCIATWVKISDMLIL